jgi:hypothetical protein
MGSAFVGWRNYDGWQERFELQSGRGGRDETGQHQPENSVGIYCKLSSFHRK